MKRKLAEIYVELKPQAAFIHHTEDHWPDHVACGQAAHDALLFSHGLSHDMRAAMPADYAFRSRPGRRTISSRTCITSGRHARIHGAADRHRFVPRASPVEEVVRYEFQTLGKVPQTLRLGGHGVVSWPIACGSARWPAADLPWGFARSGATAAERICFEPHVLRHDRRADIPAHALRTRLSRAYLPQTKLSRDDQEPLVRTASARLRR